MRYRIGLRLVRIFRENSKQSNSKGAHVHWFRSSFQWAHKSLWQLLQICQPSCQFHDAANKPSVSYPSSASSSTNPSRRPQLAWSFRRCRRQDFHLGNAWQGLRHMVLRDSKLVLERCKKYQDLASAQDWMNLRGSEVGAAVAPRIAIKMENVKVNCILND